MRSRWLGFVIGLVVLVVAIWAYPQLPPRVPSQKPATTRSGVSLTTGNIPIRSRTTPSVAPEVHDLRLEEDLHVLARFGQPSPGSVAT